MRIHIGKDNKPHICTAAPGHCPLGGPHYGNMEQAYEALYIRQSRSLKNALSYKDK